MNNSQLKKYISAMVLAGAACAAAAAPASFSDVRAGTYKADPFHTQVVFSILHMGFSNFLGEFSGAAGTLQLDPAKPAASKLSLTVRVDSVSTLLNKLNEELKTAEWLDAIQFPTAKFVSTKIVPLGDGAFTVTGDFTFHGVTREVVLAAQFVGSGVNPITKAYTVGFDAKGAIKRSDFGVKAYVPLIGDEVKLILTGAFELQE
jgi:polyisoprenoid-binding protein YceI